MRGLLIGLLVVAALLVGVDRLGAYAAGRAIATQAQSSGALSRRPEVDVRGFPFLTQLVRGRYDDVHLMTSGDVGGVPVERLEADLRGVRLPLRDAVHGDVQRVPVDAVRGTVLLSFAELSRRAGNGLTVTGAGDRVRVKGSVDVLGRTLSAAAVSSVRLDGDRVKVRAEQFSTGSGVADSVLGAAVGSRFDFSVRVGELPYGLRLTGLHVQPDGVALTAASGATVLSR